MALAIGTTKARREALHVRLFSTLKVDALQPASKNRRSLHAMPNKSSSSRMSDASGPPRARPARRAVELVSWRGSRETLRVRHVHMLPLSATQ